MTELERQVERVLPRARTCRYSVVADSWTQLRKCDVYRLMAQFSHSEWDSVRQVILTYRPDLSKAVKEAIADLKEFYCQPNFCPVDRINALSPEPCKCTYYKVHDAEALAVLIRYAESCGFQTTVRPINDWFAAKVHGEIQITNDTKLKLFVEGIDYRRTYWADIVEVSESATSLLSVFKD